MKPKLQTGEITPAERERALERLIEREVKVMRHEDYRTAEAEKRWMEGGQG